MYTEDLDFTVVTLDGEKSLMVELDYSEEAFRQFQKAYKRLHGMNVTEDDFLERMMELYSSEKLIRKYMKHYLDIMEANFYVHPGYPYFELKFHLEELGVDITISPEGEDLFVIHIDLGV